MNIHLGLLGAIVVLLVGFYVGKKYPGLFASVPVVNSVL